MTLEEVRMITDSSLSEEATRGVKAIQDSLWACIQPRFKREGFRPVFKKLTLRLSLTESGQLKAISGLTPSTLKCARESSSQWKLAPLPAAVEFEATYVVEEFCQLVPGQPASLQPCVPRIYPSHDPDY